MASLVVFLVVTPFAGVLADRLPRLAIMVVCQIVCGVSQSLSGVLVLAGSATVWSLGMLAVLTAAAGAFFQPAAKELITAIVERDELVAANALLQIAGNVIAIIAPTLAGLAIVAASPGWVLAGDGLTFLASAALFALLRLGAARARQQRRGLIAELVEGLSAFGRRRWLWVLTCLQALTSACWGAGFTVSPEDRHIAQGRVAPSRVPCWAGDSLSPFRPRRPTARAGRGRQRLPTQE
ncbi:MFS transporter [Nonomuraea sp. GTA35]|uniref:MFS transporter n=1 Tax=Nonomuraea sp. GTA35 TaxID=1676746 RepID=UPI0035C0634C